MTTRETTEMFDPGLFAKLRDLLARPDMVDFCRRATAPATIRRNRSDLRHIDLRSWKD